MKKIFIFINLIIYLLLVGCKESKEEKALNDFLNASDLETDIFMDIESQETNLSQKFCSLKINPEGLELRTVLPKTMIYVNYERNVIVLTSDYYKYYTYISPVGGDTEISSKEEKFNINDYIYDKKIESEKFEFKFDIKKIMDEAEIEQEIIPNMPSYILCYGTYKDGLVDTFSIDLTSFIDLFGDIGVEKLTKLSLTLKNINYTDYVYLSSFIISQSHIKVSETQMLYLIIAALTPNDSEPDPNPNPTPDPDPNPTPDPEPVPMTYKLGWYENYYTIVKNSGTYRLMGQLDTNYMGVSIPFDNCNISYSPALDLNKIGETKYTLTIEYEGNTFNAEITINVSDVLESKETIKVLETGFNKTFRFENYLLISDANKLYKYNLETRTLDGNVDIKCVANSYYYKDGYIYVAANYYAESYWEDEDYKGVITKIKFDDFTIDKQVEVNCYPYSIFVDKRGDVIVGKGEDQWIEYSKVNLETGELTSLMQGYEKDYLIYREDKDAFLSITQSISSDNEWHRYINGVGYTNQVIESNNSISSISYIVGNGEIMLGLSWNELYVATFDENINDYKMSNHNYLPSLLLISLEKYKLTYHENKVYILGLPYSSQTGVLIEYDLITKTKKYNYITLTTKNVESINFYNNEIYVSYLDAKILEVYSLN